MKTVVTIILSFSILFNYINSEDLDTKQNELTAILDVANNNEMKVESWVIYSRESIGHVKTEAEMDASFEEIMKENSSYSWIKEEEQVDHHYVITGTKVDKENGMTDKIVVTAYQRGVFEMTLSHEVSGDNENLHLLEDLNLDYTDNQEVFYTVRGAVTKDHNGLLKQANGLVEDFEATEIEGLYESNFVAMSLMSDKFDRTVTTSEDKEMNLQIGLRTTESDDSVDVTIGTPIITTEY